MNTAFHQRCASALTNPATVAALAVLIINDLALKAIWSNPWTTGKLSDLAWVAFASPLLAFILSFPARRSRFAHRAAFIIAYIGLPALYAAFNTFEPLHDLIISALLLASGASVGSPFDPTDSLVIPIGLAVALWVWKRPITQPDSLRVRLALLMAGVAAFATIATSQSEPRPPTGRVGLINDETLVVDLFPRYFSSDGGLTWREDDLWDGAQNQLSVQWGGNQTQTQRGTYTFDEDNLLIIHTSNGKSELAYSMAHLNDEANVRFQEYMDRRIYQCDYDCRPWRLRSLVYDSGTGNIVVAAGVQGVVVGDADGNWKQVAVGRSKPIDFSLGNKLRVVLLDLYLWWTALALSIPATAAALAMAHFSGAANGDAIRNRGSAPTRYGMSHRFAETVGSLRLNKIITIITAGIIVLLLGGLLLSGNAFIFVLAAFLVVWGIALIPRSAPLSGCVTVVGIVILLCSTIASLIGLTLVFATSMSPDSLDELLLVMSLGASILLGTMPCMAFRPSLPQLPIVLAALLGMIALFALAFVIGVVQGFDLTAAKFYAVILILMAALTLASHLRRSKNPSQHQAD